MFGLFNTFFFLTFHMFIFFSLESTDTFIITARPIGIEQNRGEYEMIKYKLKKFL